MPELTHSYLNDVAQRWLQRSHSAKGPGCHVAFTEVGGLFGGERADAWGFRWYGNWMPGSVLVEVKVSRSDFLADAKKPHRNGEKPGMGNYRYFMCPEGLINESDLPAKWGLIWVNSRGHAKVVCGHVLAAYGMADAWHHEADTATELTLMSHLLKRLGDPEKLNRDFKLAHLEANRLRDMYNKAVTELRELRWKVTAMEMGLLKDKQESANGN